MKKIIFCLIACFFFIGHFAKAQCRVIAPDAEEWIGKNKEKIAKMNRAEWQKLEEGYKWIVFMELSPKQAHDFYIQKIEQVRDDFEWTETEKEHIEKLNRLFMDNPDMYSKEKDEKKDAEIKKFLDEWVKQAMEKLKWTPKLIQGIAMTCEDLLDKEGNVRVTSKVKFEIVD